LAQRKGTKGLTSMKYILVITLTILVGLYSQAAPTKNLTDIGSYKVRLANTANHLNCRTGPGTHFPVRARLQQGESIQVLHVTAHSKPWFYTNMRCFVRASSSFLTKLKNKPSHKETDKPKIIR